MPVELISCGLNGDWSVSAWEVMETRRPRGGCNTLSGSLYLLDVEDDDRWQVVRRWYINDEGDGYIPGWKLFTDMELEEWGDGGSNDLIVPYFEGTQEACLDFLRGYLGDSARLIGEGA